MFDDDQIFMGDGSESESEPLEGSVEPERSIHEERRVVDLLFLANGVENHPSGAGGPLK